MRKRIIYLEEQMGVPKGALDALEMLEIDNQGLRERHAIDTALLSAHAMKNAQLQTLLTAKTRDCERLEEHCATAWEHADKAKRKEKES